MLIARDIYITVLASLLVILVASCASLDETSEAVVSTSEEITPSVEAYEESIVITGSRVPASEAVPVAQAEELQMRSRSAFRLERAYASAQQPSESQKEKIVSWKPSKQAANNAVIKVGDTEEILPQALDVKVQVDGFRARILIDGFYFNKHAQNLEGSFKFRLPDGAVPYFFAFGEAASFQTDSLKQIVETPSFEGASKQLVPDNIMQARSKHWKEPKQAIMVTKEKAAFAYHDTVAQQIDPALLEWAGAGIFSAKVFPLRANRVHRVVIGYDLNLKQVKKNLFLDLPLTDLAIPKRVHLLLNQPQNSQIDIHRIVDDEIRKPIVLKNEEGVTQETLFGSMLSGVRVIVDSHQPNVLLGTLEEQSYFSSRWTNTLPMNKTIANEKAVFVVDTSLSASPEKFHLWVNLVSEILTNNQSEMKEFALLTFNTAAIWWQQNYLMNNADNRERLNEYLNQLVLEGATNLNQALNLATQTKWIKYHNNGSNDYDIFLLSDGAITWGEKAPYFISASMQENFSGRIFAYRLGAPGEDADLLAHLTREIGGATFQLNAKNDIRQVSQAHRMLPWQIDSVSLEGANDILISGRPNSTYPGEELIFSGRVDSELGKALQIELSQGAYKKRLKIPLNSSINSNLTPRIYGQIAVNQLESIGDLERKVASAYANHFRVPGQSSSLLMLETQSDYQRYNIQPNEDAFVVSKLMVNNTFAKLADGFTLALSDPKKRFVTQLEKLKKLDFLDFNMPDAVTLLIESMPLAAFQLDFETLTVNNSERRNIDNQYLEKIAEQKVDYEVVEEEAARRLKNYGEIDALNVMSSLVELAPSDTVVMRDVAFAAESWNLPSQAFQLHRQVSDLRPYEPHSYTYMAKLASQLGKSDLALLYFEMGLASNWQGRFGDYNLIHKIDYANFLDKAIGSNNQFESRDYARYKFKRLKKEINLKGSDLIVAISWNTDRTDIDLHIVEPNGEECFYQHKRTRSGGYITKDVTGGYGPEMYINQSAPRGKYDLLVNYYSSDRNKLGLKTKVLVRTIRDWGTTKQSEETQTVVLRSQKEKQRIKVIRI